MHYIQNDNLIKFIVCIAAPKPVSFGLRKIPNTYLYRMAFILLFLWNVLS